MVRAILKDEGFAGLFAGTCVRTIPDAKLWNGRHRLGYDWTDRIGGMF